MMDRFGQRVRRATAIFAAALSLVPCLAQSPASPKATEGAVVTRVPSIDAASGASSVKPEDLPPPRRGVDIDEHLGRTLPLELDFVNSVGERVYLKDYFKDNRPAIVALVYYRCPVVCSVVMEKLAQCLGKLDLTLGKDFKVLMFSFNPLETTEEASKLRSYYLAGYPREMLPEWSRAWEFHTGEAASAKTLADALGFRYRMLDNGEYSHPVAFFVVTPDGRVSRYIYGFDYPPRDVKLALNEAASGRLMTSLGDRLSAFCYMWDPAKQGYTLQAMRVMQVGGVLTLLALGTLVGSLIVVERVKKRKRGIGEAVALGRTVIAARGEIPTLASPSSEGTR